MHRVSLVKIENFRACKNVVLPLEGYTPLVGQNNSGKSTILEAIRWVLKPSSVSQSDFSDSDSPIVVTACIEGISDDVLERIPEKKHRSAIEPYCKNGKLWIRASATASGVKNLTKEVWDISHCTDDDFPDHWRSYPTGLPQAVAALLPEPIVIEAMENLHEDLGKAKAGTTIKGLLDEIMGPMLKAHSDLSGALDTIRSILTTGGENRSNHLQTFDDTATQALEQFFPGLQLDLDLQIVEIKEFFKSGDLHVTDATTGERRKFDQMGTGAQRAIQMALVRYLAESANSDDSRPSRRLLLIDEPELYLHPQGVRRLGAALAQLSQAGFQTIFSTHSPMMLSRENAHNTIRVKNEAGTGVCTRKPMRQAVEQALDSAESQSRTLFQLGNIADIYFSDIVVLCEGKTDRRLLPLAYEVIYGSAPELHHIAFISLGSCADIPKALLVLKSMGIKTRAVADLDFGYTHARSGGLLEKTATDMADMKAVLNRLQPVHGYALGGNGLPLNQRNGGWMASDVWSTVVSDERGSSIAKHTHEALLAKNVWIWPVGCIEQITGCAEKGEDAILEQEEQLRTKTTVEIDSEMPDFRNCFEWILG